MAQDGNTSGGNSYTLDNVTFPIGRNKLQSIFDAIRSTNKGSSAPNLVAGQFWVDDSAGTTWVLYFYDGSNSIQFATIDTSANTINFTDSALDVVTDTTPQLGGTLDTNGKLIQFGDSSGATDDRLQFGASQDLSIYHDGSNTHIKNSGSDFFIAAEGADKDLYLRSDDDVFIQSQGGEHGIKVVGNGAVELYYDNNKKAETTSTGLDVSGGVNATSLAVNGGDITQTTGYVIKNTNGHLFLQSASSKDVIFRVDGGTEKMRLTTTGLGIGTTSINSKLDVRGTGAVSLNVGSTDGTTARLTLDATNGDASGGDFPLLISDGTSLNIEANNSGGNAYTAFRTNGTERARIGSGGGLSINTTANINNSPLFISTGTNDNIRIGQETHASIQAVNDAESSFVEMKLDGSSLLLNSQSSGNVGINTVNPASNLHIKTSVDNSLSQGLVIERSANSDRGYINYNGGAFQIRSTVGDPIVFGETDSEHVRILPDGNVGIGTSSIDVLFNRAFKVLQLENDEGGQINLDHNDAGTGSTLGMINFNRAGTTVAHIGGVTDGATDSGQINFRTQATGGALTERMRINSSGNVGIGEISPLGTMHIKSADSGMGSVNANADELVIEGSGNSGLTILSGASNKSNIFFGDSGSNAIGDIGYDHSSNALNIGVNGSEAVRIDSSQRVGIGTSSPSSFNSQARNLVVGTGSGDAGMSIYSGSGSGDSGNIFFADGTSGDDPTRGGITYKHDTNQMQFRVNDANRVEIASDGKVGIGTASPAHNVEIVATASGSVNDSLQIRNNATASGTGSRIRFINSTDNASDTNGASIASVRTGNDNDLVFETENAEAMRIDSGNNIRFCMESFASGVGTSNYGFDINQNGSSPFIQHATNGTGLTTRYNFINDNGVVGKISTDGSATTYAVSSDYRLKENVVTDWDATTRLKQLKPSRFNFIADADKTVDGFLAHEVSSIVPEAIIGEKNEVDSDGNAVYQCIDQSKLVPLLVKTIQELEARITTLENN